MARKKKVKPETPEPTFRDAASLRAMGDPLRLRMTMLMLEAPRTVKELAAELGVPPTRLYYHVRILEEHGLIEVTDRRMVSGIEERRYRAIRDSLTVAPEVGASAIESSGALAALLAAVRAEMEVALYDGPDLPVGDPASALPVLTLTDLVLTQEDLADVVARLTSILEDYAVGQYDAPPEARHYHFLFAGYLAPEAAVLLDVRDVTKRYRGGVIANDGITLHLEAGEVFGLLGPNGAGKTTLVSQILGLATPTTGTITIDGIDVVRSPAVARRECSYQPQGGAPVDGLSPREAVEIAGRLRGGDRSTVNACASALLAALELDEWEHSRVPLSGGVARLVSFSMAAVVPGRIVVLDEPTNDVDPLRRKLLWQQVRALADNGAAVLLVTHNVLEAERCVDRLAVVDHGRVVAQGTPAALKSELGGALRLELVLEPGAEAPATSPFGPATTVGRRLFIDVVLDDAISAVTWVRDLHDAGTVAEFYLGPTSLEDVYVRRVRDTEVAVVV